MNRMTYAKVLTHITDAGQQVIGVRIGFSEAVPAAGDPANYLVKGRRVVSAERGEGGESVRIELDPQDRNAFTRVMADGRPGAKAVFVVPELVVTYIPTGEVIRTSGAEDDLADRFFTGSYEDPDSGVTLCYNLYVPEHAEAGKEYPLVVFLHDSGSCSDQTKAPLYQGTGAICWMTPEAQEKHPCFVLAPQFPSQIADDDFQVTAEVDAVMGLIRKITEIYPVDSERIYGTGQSMGTMTLCELLLRNPGFFAACFLAAGQWDPERMAAAKEEKLWILISENDEKAWPIMGTCVRNMEGAGARVARGSWSARDPKQRQELAAEALGQTQANLIFSWFTGDSVKPEGMPEFPGVYHICTWRYSFRIAAIRDWLFRQRRAVENAPESPEGELWMETAMQYMKQGDYAQAERYLRMAAEAGDVRAQEHLAEGCLHGQGGQPDYTASYRWAEAAAGQGSARAHTVLGLLYLEGKGVAQDFEKAAVSLQKAIELGDMKAPRHLGRMYEQGLGVTRDPEAAYRLYLQAAQRGDITGQYQVGRCYEEGIFVEKNLSEAITWYQRSAQRGGKPAKEAKAALSRLGIPFS